MQSAIRRLLLFTVAILPPILAATDPAAANKISYFNHCHDVLRDPPLLPDPNPPITNWKFLVVKPVEFDQLLVERILRLSFREVLYDRVWFW
ncbi:hypothetical protein OROHE_011446 [Orobanche hederae]